MLAPFAAVFGGVAQLLAGMWSYRARDRIATAAHGACAVAALAEGFTLFAVLGLLTIGSAEPAIKHGQ